MTVWPRSNAKLSSMNRPGWIWSPVTVTLPSSASYWS